MQRLRIQCMYRNVQRLCSALHTLHWWTAWLYISLCDQRKFFMWTLLFKLPRFLSLSLFPPMRMSDVLMKTRINNQTPWLACFTWNSRLNMPLLPPAWCEEKKSTKWAKCTSGWGKHQHAVSHLVPDFRPALKTVHGENTGLCRRSECVTKYQTHSRLWLIQRALQIVSDSTNKTCWWLSHAEKTHKPTLLRAVACKRQGAYSADRRRKKRWERKDRNRRLTRMCASAHL